MTLEEQLQQARETNSRLNRRNQELESHIKKQGFWSLGWRAGYDKARNAARAEFKTHYEQRLADYKHATRNLIKQTKKNNGDDQEDLNYLAEREWE